MEVIANRLKKYHLYRGKAYLGQMREPRILGSLAGEEELAQETDMKQLTNVDTQSSV